MEPPSICLNLRAIPCFSISRVFLPSKYLPFSTRKIYASERASIVPLLPITHWAHKTREQCAPRLECSIQRATSIDCSPRAKISRLRTNQAVASRLPNYCFAAPFSKRVLVSIDSASNSYQQNKKNNPSKNAWVVFI